MMRFLEKGRRHRGVHLDLNAGQREEKQTERRSKPAAAVSLPSCPGVRLPKPRWLPPLPAATELVTVGGD